MKTLRSAILLSAMALALVLCLPGRSAASDTTSIAAVFNRAIAAFNSGNMNGWAATCSSTTSIVDEVPPHAWQSCTDWWRSYNSYTKANHITAGTVTTGQAANVQLTGNTAYAEWPATFRYHQNGKTQQETGLFTVAFTKTATGWLMSGWTWTKR